MNQYATYNSDQLEDLFSRFLIDSWSYSRVALFARNEKEFERTAIYREPNNSSATTIAGQAYHAALENYFRSYPLSLALEELQSAAYKYIDAIPESVWKLNKTTPTYDSAKVKATQLTTALLTNFLAEVDIYTADIAEIIDVEATYIEWLTINGVDIPLPCHARLDLVVQTRDGKIAIIDHKSKTTYTPEDEIALSSGKQAITYYKVLEARGIIADEVWFIENKSSKNKDGSPQLRKNIIALDLDTTRMYEAMLYEPLRRMLEAVSDPDYVYTINDSDPLADRAALYDFWAKTMIAEVEDFNISPRKQELIRQRQRKIRDAATLVNPKVITKFRDNAATFIAYENTTNMSNAEKIEHLLRTFALPVKVAHQFNGYSSDTYLLEVGAGVRIPNILKSKIDLANALNVPAIRIGDTLHVHDGISYVSLEAPKKRTEDLLFDPAALHDRRIPIGRDNFRNLICWDLNSHATPHILVCGATGSGKSVCVRSTIEYAKLAGVKNIIVFDPKYEFLDVDGIEIYNDIEDIETMMSMLVQEMQETAKARTKRDTLIIFDEFADAMQSARKGKQLAPGEKSLEENLKMLLQKGRSLGYRIMAATQRASTKVITGDAKVNFPVQLCFRVPKALDSQVVIDEEGAETLSGSGDALMRSPEYNNTLVRLQGYYYGKP